MAAIGKFYKDLQLCILKKRLWSSIIGMHEFNGVGYPVYVLRTHMREVESLPRMLVVAGFHGEEKAGPYAILKWLESCDPEVNRNYDVSFIPIVNPVGFKKDQRYGATGEKTNCGFCHPERGDIPSPEAKVIINNIDMLRSMADDGFLSLHEDATETRYYTYSFEKGRTTPGAFSAILRDTLGRFFKTRLDGEIVEVDASGRGPLCKDGIVYRHCDGSMEDWMFHLGVPKVAVTETPGTYSIDRRIKAHVEAINIFIEMITEVVKI